jgi:diguanylate cyclase (GGDEF)-like protein
MILFVVLTTLGSVLFLFGFASLTSYPIKKNPFYAYVAIVPGIAITLRLLQLPDSYISILLSGTYTIISIAYITVLLKTKKTVPWFNRTFNIIIAIYLLFGTFHCLRFLRMLSSLPSGKPVQIINLGSQCISQLVTMILLSGINYCVLILIYKQLLHDLALDAKEKEAMLSRLKILAENDGMTGIFNRTTIEKHLDRRLKENNDSSGNLLILIDVDSFKAINDETGHESGDNVLIALARLFKDFVCDTGSAGRWGGDEFLILTTKANQEEVAECLQTLQDTVHDFPWDAIFDTTPHPTITISCGYVFFRTIDIKQDILRKADNYLYQAKKQGGDCSVGT